MQSRFNFKPRYLCGILLGMLDEIDIFFLWNTSKLCSVFHRIVEYLIF